MPEREGTDETWVFFDKCLFAARNLRKDGMGEDQITETLKNTTEASLEFARYIARGACWPSYKRRKNPLTNQSPLD